VPRRIKTVHHHHHHVVLMDPKSKKIMHTKPYSGRSLMAGGYHQQQQQQQYTQHHQQQQQMYKQEQQYLQSVPVVDHPSSYQEQRKAIGANVLLLPAAQMPVVHVPVAYTAWPARKKRSSAVDQFYTH
jgi:hypothetical protein